MAVIAMTITTAVAVVVIITVAAVMTPGKGSEENPEKSVPRREKRFPLGLLARNKARVEVIGAPINVSPA